MSRVGRIDSLDPPVVISEPGPHCIHPLKSLHVGMALQRILFTGGGAPAGRHLRREINGSGLSRFVLPDQIQSVGQGIAQQVLNIDNRQTRTPIHQPPHSASSQPTGSDLRKALEVTADVQSEAMLGNPTTTTHPDGSHFAVVQPDPRESWKSLPLQANLRQDIDHHLLQLPQVPVEIWLPTA